MLSTSALSILLNNPRWGGPIGYEWAYCLPEENPAQECLPDQRDGASAYQGRTLGSEIDGDGRSTVALLTPRLVRLLPSAITVSKIDWTECV